MDNYQILYTETAIRDMEEKLDYISLNLHDPSLAVTWYQRLRSSIQDQLSSFPKKYSLYSAAPWREKGVRQLLLRNDIVLYSVDESKKEVYILGVCTRGRDLSAHLNNTLQ